MAAHPSYDSVETLAYSGGFSNLFTVLIADTMDEALRLADFIETNNLLNGDGKPNGIIQAFWNP